MFSSSITPLAILSVALTAGALNVGSTDAKGVLDASSQAAHPSPPALLGNELTNTSAHAYQLSNLLPMVATALLQTGARDHVTSFDEFPGHHKVSFLNVVYGREVDDSDSDKKIIKAKEVVDDDYFSLWGDDVFPQSGQSMPKDGDEGLNFFRAATPADWFILLAVSIVLLLLDALLLRRAPDTFHWHLACVFLWVVIAACFNFSIWGRMTYHKAFEWCSGYILEWMLSMDNLFVFHLIFHAYHTPPKHIQKAVFVGIAGAMLMRMLFFMLVSTLLHLFSWFRWPFGVLLVWSGIQAAKGDDDDTDDIQDTKLCRMVKFFLGDRLMEGYSPEPHCFVYNETMQKWQATMLVMVIICLEFTDILFALDSVSAKVAQIPDQYVAFSSSVLAMFGLRAMFFIIKDLVNMFDMLQYGLCIILVFIGLELMFSKMIHLASSTVCIMILAVFGICILGSHVRRRFKPATKDVAN